MSKQSSDHLFKLIKSLSKAEKRYFKLYATRHIDSENNNYVTLFDAIDAKEEYDEEAIINLFRKKAKSVAKNFSIAKSRLHDVVLRSLAAFHSDNSVDGRLKRELHIAEILFKKMQYDECRRVLVSAKKIAQKYDKHLILLDIYQWEKNLMTVNSFAEETEEDIEALLKQDTELLEKIRNHSEYWDLKSKFILRLNKKGNLRDRKELERFRDIVEHALLQSEEKALTYKSKVFYYHILSTYHFVTGDHRRHYEVLKKYVAMMEAHPEMIEEEPHNYVTVLMNLINSCHLLRLYDEIGDYLRQIRQVPERLPTNTKEFIEVKIFADSYNTELGLHIEQGTFSKGAELIPAIEDGMARYGSKINRMQKVVLYYNMAVICFGTGKIAEALKCVNQLLNDKDVEITQDIYCFTRILNLIIHLELENDDLLPYILKSTHRYLETRNRMYRFESVILDFIKKILRTKSPQENKALYQKLRDEFAGLKKDPFESKVFGYFDFISWAESKLQGRPFGELVKEARKEVA